MSRKPKQPQPAKPQARPSWPSDPSQDEMYPFRHAPDDMLDHALEVGVNSQHPMSGAVLRAAAAEVTRRMSMGQLKKRYAPPEPPPDDEDGE